MYKKNYCNLAQLSFMTLGVGGILILAMHTTTKPNAHLLPIQKLPSSLEVVYTSVKIKYFKYTSNIADPLIESRMNFSKTVYRRLAHKSHQIRDCLVSISTSKHSLVLNCYINICCGNFDGRRGERPRKVTDRNSHLVYGLQSWEAYSRVHNV